MIRLKFKNLKCNQDIRKLPPKDFALLEHTNRVYFKCQVWIRNNHISLLDWG